MKEQSKRLFLLEALQIPCELREAKDLNPIVQYIEGLKIFAVFSGTVYTSDKSDDS